jgi:hypothetical protein
MAYLLEKTESYRCNSENEAKEFIEKVKEEASEGGYTVKSYSSTLKEKKAKKEIVDSGYLVKISKIYGDFWEEEY